MALPEALERNYRKFQAKNDLPVFLKGGPIDRVLFGTTMALCGIGIISIFHMVYEMGFKKKSG